MFRLCALLEGNLTASLPIKEKVRKFMHGYILTELAKEIRTRIKENDKSDAGTI